MKKLLLLTILFSIGFIFANEVAAQKRKPKPPQGKICGNPNIKCRTGDWEFPSYEIPFEVPRDNTVIFESEFFYAIVLKSAKSKGYEDCEKIFPEKERLEIQDLFPNNKVFALKCLEPGNLYYTNIAFDVNFIAVYAGKTLTEANKFLKTVQATGKFKGVSVRRMQAAFNGT